MQYLHRVKDQERLKKYMVRTTEVIVFSIGFMFDLFVLKHISKFVYFLRVSIQPRYSYKRTFSFNSPF